MEPSEISGDEEHVSNPWGSAGKPPEMGAVELLLQPRPGLDPSEQHRHIAEGSIARMRCCYASYSHMLHVANQSDLFKKKKTGCDDLGRFAFPMPSGVESI